jgi:hypothetical protein
LTTAVIYGQGMGEKVALITDGRFSGATRGMHRLPFARSAGRWTNRAVGMATASASTPQRAVSIC